MDDTGSNTAYKSKKIIVLFVVVVFLLALLAVFFTTSSNNTQKEQTTAPTTSAPQPQFQNTLVEPPANPPDVDRSELENQIEETKKTYEKHDVPVPTETIYQFEYKLDPELLNNNPQSDSSLFGVHAQETGELRCNTANLPQTAPLFTLKSHIPATEAKKIAENYKVMADVSAIVQSGVTQYVFADPALSPDYVTIYEPSATSFYHHVTTDAQDPIDEFAAQAKAIEALDQYGLIGDSIDTSKPINAANVPAYYAYRFNKKWPHKVVDSASVKAIELASICDVADAADMNYIQADLKSDGQISNIIDKTRKSVKSVSLPLLDLQTAVNTYKDNPLEAPLVFGPGITAGAVTLQEAALVYYDRGELIGQSCYVPTYLVSGTVSGARIVSMFPAVAEDITASLCKTSAVGTGGIGSQIPTGTAGDTKNTLKYSTILMEFPTATPQPTPKSFDKCFGNQADYFFKCKTSTGTQVCSAFLGIPAADDQWDTCHNNCQFPVGDMVLKNTGDVCKTFATKIFEMKSQTLPSTYKTVVPASSSSTSKKYCSPYLPSKCYSGTRTTTSPPTGGDVTCSFQTCPC